MSDADLSNAAPSREVLVPELASGPGGPEPDGSNDSSIIEPGKVLRIGSMIRTLLEEVRQTQLDEESRDRLRDIYDASVKELAQALSPELQEELMRLALPFDADVPSEAELRIAKAQLVGWLEGLFHGIQAALFAQQMAARQQLAEMRGSLPSGQAPSPDGRPGNYL